MNLATWLSINELVKKKCLSLMRKESAKAKSPIGPSEHVPAPPRSGLPVKCFPCVPKHCA